MRIGKRIMFAIWLCCLLILFVVGGRALAMLDLEQTNVRYESEGGTYILKPDTDKDTIIAPAYQGDYLIEDETQSGWSVSFDYD